MADYVTDMTKRPVEMLLGLINNDNNFGLVEADVEILAPTTIASPDEYGRDTSVQIDLEVLPSEVEDDFVTFTYIRIDLANLFSQFAPSVREVDVPLNLNGVPADAAVFYAEILRKFGVAMNTEDFEYELKSAGVITVKAKPTNLAYQGAFDINIGASLKTRVATTILDGFEIPTQDAAPAN